MTLKQLLDVLQPDLWINVYYDDTLILHFNSDNALKEATQLFELKVAKIEVMQGDTIAVSI